MSFPSLFPTDDAPQPVLSVWELTRQIKALLEESFPSVCVEAEISDFARPSSGHCYMTLKDDRAQIRAVIWRSTAARVRFDLHDGLAVVCRGHLDLYAPRGSYQLIVDAIEPKGVGALELAFRQLHERLSKEGLFRPERKRPLPVFPQRIGVVTSPTGAAIHDFLQVLRRRWPGLQVLIAPVRVQGEGAAEEIAAGIEMLNRLAKPVDCLVVTRGGGSIEDLWSFNEERVVRAICASAAPVVSAVGHEIDVTLSDLAADVRALTPSEAAERVAPAADEVAAQLAQWQRRLRAAGRSNLGAARSLLESLAKRPVFRRPADRIRELSRRLDELAARSDRAVRQLAKTARQKAEGAGSRLESLSPLAVLCRGFSLTERLADGRVVRDSAELAPGDAIATRLARGRAISRVERVE